MYPERVVWAPYGRSEGATYHARDQAGRAVIRQTLTSHLQARQVLGNRELAARFCTGSDQSIAECPKESHLEAGMPVRSPNHSFWVHY